ncbi:MAG TPA: hypothetical protein VFQ33_01605, partial [Xanthobacteraceae bacterium]|nr:hypothetical protein [Xanthobacteraceae bacterium]
MSGGAEPRMAANVWKNEDRREVLMQFLQSRGMLLAAAIAAGGADAQESTTVKELIPTGKLRA